MIPSTKSEESMKVEELGHHPHRVWAGGGGLPDGGWDEDPRGGEDQDGQCCRGREQHHPHKAHVGVGDQPVRGREHVQQAGVQGHHPPKGHGGVGGQPVRGQEHVQQAAEVHGCRHHGTVNRDTVNMPVNIVTLTCGYEECPFSTGDHVQGSAEEDHKWLMENHFELEHPPPSLVVVEGGMARITWQKFAEWFFFFDLWIVDKKGQNYEEKIFTFLDKSLGKLGDLIWENMGDKYYELSGGDLLKEARIMCMQLWCLGPMKPSELIKMIKGQEQKSSIVRQRVKANRERELHELPGECGVPHFQCKKLVGARGVWYKQRLAEKKVKFSLTDGELVTLLWSACQRHPLILEYVLGNLGPEWKGRPIPKLRSMGSDWLLECMTWIAMKKRESIVNTKSSSVMVAAVSNTEPSSDTEKDETDVLEKTAGKSAVAKSSPVKAGNKSGKEIPAVDTAHEEPAVEAETVDTEDKSAYVEPAHEEPEVEAETVDTEDKSAYVEPVAPEDMADGVEDTEDKSAYVDPAHEEPAVKAETVDTEDKSAYVEPVAPEDMADGVEQEKHYAKNMEVRVETSAGAGVALEGPELYSAHEERAADDGHYEDPQSGPPPQEDPPANPEDEEPGVGPLMVAADAVTELAIATEHGKATGVWSETQEELLDAFKDLAVDPAQEQEPEVSPPHEEASEVGPEQVIAEAAQSTAYAVVATELAGKSLERCTRAGKSLERYTRAGKSLEICTRAGKSLEVFTRAEKSTEDLCIDTVQPDGGYNALQQAREYNDLEPYGGYSGTQSGGGYRDFQPGDCYGADPQPGD